MRTVSKDLLSAFSFTGRWFRLLRLTVDRHVQVACRGCLIMLCSCLGTRAYHAHLHHRFTVMVLCYTLQGGCTPGRAEQAQARGNQGAPPAALAILAPCKPSS